MKTIGVMTFWRSNENYGQVLQAYALQTILTSFGFEAEVIDYDPSSRQLEQAERLRTRPLIRKLLSVLSHPIVYAGYYGRRLESRRYKSGMTVVDRHFEDFRKARIRSGREHYSSLTELRARPPKYDVYICGSDIVWSEQVDDMAYFLDFGEKNVLRVAFAASFGGASISEGYAKRIAEYLSSFDFIGVRENSGVGICSQAGRDDAVWTPDPTLLLSKEQYEEIMRTPELSEKYMLIYLLGYKLDIDKKEVFSFAREKGWRVVYVANDGVFDDYERVYPTIEEWIGYIAGAEYVVTNSFHCAVFCSIFNTDFTFDKIKGGNSAWNERFFSLMNMLGLNQSEFMKLRDSRIDESVWENVNAKLSEIRDKKNILKNCLPSR